MPKFQVGDLVTYIQKTGIVTEVTDEYVLAEFDSDINFNGNQRGFLPDGSTQPGRTHEHLPGDYRWGNADNYRLELVSRPSNIKWESNMHPEKLLPYELPPEPKILYGVFDRNGQPIEPGHSGDRVILGYGFDNTPPGGIHYVLQTLEEANAYLRSNMELWRRHCMLTQLKAIINPLSVLEGLRINSIRARADRIDIGTSSLSFRLNYNRVGCYISIKTASEVQTHVANCFPTVVSVDDTVVTLDDGFQFGITPLYLEYVEEGFRPEIVIEGAWAGVLLEHYLNLASNESEEDSQAEAA